MAYDVFLQIDGIKGESTDSEHKDWIDVLSVSNEHPVQATTLPSPASSASSSSTKSSFTITKTVDKASPKLYEALHNGTHIPKVILELMRAGGSKVPYMTIKMEQVVISQVAAGSGKGKTQLQSSLLNLQASKPATTPTPVLQTEAVSFNYGHIKWTYTQQKRSDGSGGGNTAGK